MTSDLIDHLHFERKTEMMDRIEALIALLEKQADDDDQTLELMAQSHAVQKHTKGCKCSQIIESQRTAVANTRSRLAAIRELAPR